MSTRVRMTIFCLGLGFALTLGAVPDADARGKRTPTVQVLLDGTEATHVASGQTVTIAGTGFKPDVYLTVCVEEEGCTGSRTDSDGIFSTGRIFDVPGTHLIRVYEMSRNYSRSTLRAMTDVTVME